MTDHIIFYDLASNKPDFAWGLNNWKFPDIEVKCKEKGIAPGIVTSDGREIYTTNLGVSESLRIAEYLDKTYPDTPRILFDGIEEYDACINPFRLPDFEPMLLFILPPKYEILNPVSQEYFRRTREKSFGRKLEEFTPTGSEREETWERIKKGFDTIDGLIQKNGGPFARGEQVSFVDFAFGGYLIWFKLILGEESELWKDLVIWNDGLWGRYLERLEEYAKPRENVP
ncbi:hypothetical protein JOM56_005058 [Amanita muscaria]